ncbi:MAG TPA: hypothetical protein VNR65_05985 [Geobacterales bacterium]|nr:hypothetical protein [Geobacterales bacterium]
MPKKFALCLICWIAAFQFGLTGASAQSEPADAQFALAPQPAMTLDDPRLLLMIRNAVIALNQANLTGNYSVLRDLGTQNFQMSNNSARLAESFATLRARKLDISPVMFFNPKFVAPPSMQGGQVLRVTGFFPTTPEQVNFDLAFQLSGEQWMLAAIAVNVTPPGENVQAFAASALQPARPAETGDAKPIRIDLSQSSAPASTQPVTPKKAAPKKPKQPAQKTATAVQPAASPAPAAAPEQQPPAQAPRPPSPPSPGPAAWDPFGR